MNELIQQDVTVEVYYGTLIYLEFSANRLYNFIIVLLLSERTVVIHYCWDKKKWVQKAQIEEWAQDEAERERLIQQILNLYVQGEFEIEGMEGTFRGSEPI